MAIWRRLTRPDFEEHQRKRVVWLGASWLTAAETRELEKRLPPDMLGSVRVLFMQGVNEALKMCAVSMRSTPEGKQRDQLKAVAEKARELLALMSESKLHPDTRGAIRGSSFSFAASLPGTEPLSEFSHSAAKRNELTAHFWDTVQDIESVFSYVAGEMQPNKQAQPSRNNARVLAGALARAHFNAVGRWPAFSTSKNVWFPAFVMAIPERLGVVPGDDVIRAAIQELKKGVDRQI